MNTLNEFLKLKKEALEEANKFFQDLDQMVVEHDEEGIMEPGTMVLYDRFSLEWDLMDPERNKDTSSFIPSDEEDDWDDPELDDEDEDDSPSTPIFLFSVGVFFWQAKSGEEPMASVFIRLGGHPDDAVWRELKRVQKNLGARMHLHGQDEFWETRDVVECFREPLDSVTMADLAAKVLDIARSIHAHRQN